MHSVWHSSREEAFISDAAVNCWGHALMYKYLRGVTPVTVSVVYPSETHRTESDLTGEVVLEIYMLTYTTTCQLVKVPYTLKTPALRSLP